MMGVVLFELNFRSKPKTLFPYVKKTTQIKVISVLVTGCIILFRLSHI